MKRCRNKVFVPSPTSLNSKVIRESQALQNLLNKLEKSSSQAIIFEEASLNSLSSYITYLIRLCRRRQSACRLHSNQPVNTATSHKLGSTDFAERSIHSEPTRKKLSVPVEHFSPYTATRS